MAKKEVSQRSTARLVLKDKNKWGEDVFSLLSWFDMERVREARVMVVGAGALGNEVLKNLALFGIGHIWVVDFDEIEYSNLSRSILFRESDARQRRPKALVAAERLKEINPACQVMAIEGNVGPDVGLALFGEMDVVIACLDSRYARYLINQHCFRANVPWVDGGIENLEGYVRVFRPGYSCYECSLTDEELHHIALRTGCPDIAKVNVLNDRVATTPVSASIMGAIQVQEALKILHLDLLGEGAFRSLEGRLFKYDGMHMDSRTYSMRSYNRDCLSHDTWSPVVKVRQLGHDTPVGEALLMIKAALSANQVNIHLKNNVFIEKLILERSEREIDVLLPESRIASYLEKHPLTNDPSERIFQEFTESIGDDFMYNHLKMLEVGIPPYDIIQVSSSRGNHYVELSADRQMFFS